MSKLKTDISFKAEKIERPDKTFEEIQAEVDAFNKAQREKLDVQEVGDTEPQDESTDI